MDISEAVAAIRSLDALTSPRRAYLIRSLHDAPPTGEWGRIVDSAKAEADAAKTAREDAVEAAWRARNARPAPAPAEPRTAPQRAAQPHAEREFWRPPGPVTVTWTTPTKPLVERVQKRAEGITGAKPKPTTSPKSIEPAPHEKATVGIAHGTVRGYNHQACRCELCREAKRASRVPAGKRAPNGTIPDHGTSTSYSRGCRCNLCREAATVAARNYRARKTVQE